MADYPQNEHNPCISYVLQTAGRGPDLDSPVIGSQRSCLLTFFLNLFLLTLMLSIYI